MRRFESLLRQHAAYLLSFFVFGVIKTIYSIKSDEILQTASLFEVFFDGFGIKLSMFFSMIIIMYSFLTLINASLLSKKIIFFLETMVCVGFFSILTTLGWCFTFLTWYHRGYNHQNGLLPYEIVQSMAGLLCLLVVLLFVGLWLSKEILADAHNQKNS